MPIALTKFIPEISKKAFWIVAGLLHLIAFLQACQTGSIYLVDSIDYLSQAENLKLHNSLYAAPWHGPFRPDYFTFRPPFYGFLIYVLKFLFQGDYAILVFQMLISLSTIWGVSKFLEQQNLPAKKCNGFLLLILLLYPSQIIHCNFVMSDILFQSLLFWAFYFTVKLWQQPNYKHSIASTLFFGLAMLTKPVAFLLGISFAIFLCIPFIKQKKLKFLLPFILLPAIFIGYSTYNQRITGYYHYSSVTPIFVLKYMAKYTNGQIYGEAYADSIQDKIMVQANAMQHYGQRYEWMNEKGKEILVAHPWKFALFNVKGWFAFMFDPGRFEWVHFLNLNEGNFLGLYHVINTQGWVKGIGHFITHAPILLLLILGVCFLFNALVFYGLIQFLINPKYPFVIKVCVFLFVGYIIGSTGVLGLSRYRLAVAPLLWICLLMGSLNRNKQDANH